MKSNDEKNLQKKINKKIYNLNKQKNICWFLVFQTND
jgi:hypothetical protein